MKHFLRGNKQISNSTKILQTPPPARAKPRCACEKITSPRGILSLQPNAAKGVAPLLLSVPNESANSFVLDSSPFYSTFIHVFISSPTGRVYRASSPKHPTRRPGVPGKSRPDMASRSLQLILPQNIPTLTPAPSRSSRCFRGHVRSQSRFARGRIKFFSVYRCYAQN